MKPTILIVDDEIAIGSSLRFALENEYKVTSVTRATEAIEIIQTSKIDVVLLDWRLGKDDGLEVLSTLKSIRPETAVIMMTAYGTIESSVEAMKRGAYHYITKPLDIEELHILIEKTLEHRQLQEKIRELHHTIDKIKGYDQMIGNSPLMQNVFSIIDRVKDIDSSVLIYGESGTGKELVARAIHRNGKRKNNAFISVNCAAIPEALLESELFGYMKGAFTGAISNKQGKMEAANEGTLFLDEIAEMPLSLQAKILRILQEKEITPLGSTESKKVDVRIISATNKKLQRMITEGTFREDLYFRLNVIPLELPPLKERREDIPLLIQYFLEKYAEEMQRPVPHLSSVAEAKLLTFGYPGNIRQLGNILEYAVAMAKNREINEEDLPIVIQGEGAIDEAKGYGLERDKRIIEVPIGLTLKEAEKKIIESVLEYCSGNRKKTVEILGISERGLRNKLQLYREEDE